MSWVKCFKAQRKTKYSLISGGLADNKVSTPLTISPGRHSTLKQDVEIAFGGGGGEDFYTLYHKSRANARGSGGQLAHGKFGSYETP